MKFATLKNKREELAAKQQQLREIFDQAGAELDLDKVEVLDGDTQAKVEHIRALNAELDDIAREVEDLEVVEQAAVRAQQTQPGAAGSEPGGRDGQPRRGFMDQLHASEALRTRGVTSTLDLPETPAQMAPARQVLNTLFETSDGWSPESTRSGRLDLSPEEEPAVTDLIPAVTWGQELYKFMRETTFTNAATETAEGGSYAEATLKVEEKEEAIRKIAVWIPLTDEQLEDVPGARAYVESRLRFMVPQKLDQRILTGDPSATPPQIRGFHNTANINAQAKGGDPITDAIYKGITKVRTQGQARATGVVFHPEDWETVRLLRTSDGIYIWGSPSEAGPDRIWGLPVVQSAHETKGKALLGAFREHSLLVVRREIDVRVSDSHGDFFIEGKQAMRADMRAALVVIRPQAFTEVTDL